MSKFTTLEEITGVPIVHPKKLNHYQTSKTSREQLIEKRQHTSKSKELGKTFILKLHSTTVKFSSQIIKKCSAPTTVNPIATE
jgi:hypothetical protein